MEKGKKTNDLVTKVHGAADMIALAKRIDKGDPSPADIKALATEFERKPQLWRSLGNYQSSVFALVLKSVNQSAFVGECGKRFVEEMKTELGYHSSTFVEKLLIDEIVMRWLRLALADNAYTVNTERTHSISDGIYHEKRVTLAQKRYLKAIDTLARVRKMIAQTQAKGAEMFVNLMKTENET